MQDAPIFALGTVKAVGFPWQSVTMHCHSEAEHVFGEIWHFSFNG
jgi:hypothetical protein